MVVEEEVVLLVEVSIELVVMQEDIVLIKDPRKQKNL